MRIVACGLKVLGAGHIQTQIDAVFKAKEQGIEYVIGFDMVNEEDFTPKIETFLEQILEARAKAENIGTDFPVYLHCGETNERKND